MAEPEVRMPTTVVLAVCLDSLVPGPQDSAWRSAGYFFIPANSIKEAISHFKAGDFDLVLLGHAIPAEARERLTFLIRATGSNVPVVSMAGSLGYGESFVDATLGADPSVLLAGMENLLANKARMRASPAILSGNAS
jgi:DNA-binding response OmpR family regulator